MPPSETDLREHYGQATVRRDPAETAFWHVMRRALLMMADAIKARYL